MKLESTITEKGGLLYIAPLLDGVLLLLAFFVFGSSFVLRSGVQVDLPVSNSALPDSGSTHIVTVLQGTPPKIFFNDVRVDLAQLSTRLIEEKTKSNQVTVLADRDSSYGSVMRVALMALNQGYDVAFGTQPNEE